ncbi:MAG: hemagglutinin repeat-containing protein, partial [Acetobacter orientalis]
PVLDILSRRVTLDAKVNAQTARLVTGRSRFDYETGTVHALKTDGSKTPEFAIDSSALGGMYAGQISMLVTEAGAGVRVNGTMAANAGDMTLTTDGRLVLNGSMAAAGSVVIQVGAVQNAGTLRAGEDVRLTSAADITNTGEVAAENGLNVTASTVTNAGTMVAAGQAGAVFGATGNINNTGKVGANKGALALRATSIANTGVLRAQTLLTATAQSIVNRQGQMTSGEGEVLLSAASVLDNTLGQIAAEQGNVTLLTQTLSNESGVIQAAVNNALQAVLYTSDKNSVLTAGQSLKAHVETTLENAGQIGAGQSISILAKTVSNTQTGKIYAQDNGIVAQVQDDLSNAGVIATLAPSANITLSAHTITNDGGQLLSSGNLALTAQDISNKAGRSQSGADVTLNAEQFHNMQGVVVGNTIALSGLHTADATEILDNTLGALQTSGLLSVAATTLHNEAGKLLSQAGDVQISDYGTHGSLSNLGGDIDAARTVSVKIADYESDTKSQLYAGTSLAVIAQQKLQNSGLIRAGNGLSLSVGGNLGNTGQIAAQGGALSITVGSFVNHGQVGSLGSLDVVALDTVLNDGVFLADSTLLVKANKNIINDKGIISAEASGNISLQAAALSNKSGTIQSAKGIALSLGHLDNSAGGIEAGSFINAEQSMPDGDATITIAGINNTDTAPTVLNTHGIIQADGNIAVNATQVVNQVGLIESVAGQVALSSVATSSVASSQVDNSSGIIQAQTSVNLATPTLVNQSGQILSLTGDMVIAGSSDLISPVWLNNESGQIKSGANLNLIATSWRDDVASIISSVGGMMLSAQQGVSNTGHIVAGQGLTLTAPSLMQATGSVLAAQTSKLSMNLSGTDGLSNAGTIEAVDKGGVVTIVAQAGDITNSGVLVAGQNMSLRASGQILNTAQIGSLNGGLSFNATSLVNESEITAPGSVSAELSKVLTNSGLIFSGTDLLAFAGQEINNSQTLLQGGTTLKGLGAKNSLALNAPKIENISGQITSKNNKITLRTQNDVNDNGVLQAGTDVLINTANLSNLNGRIIAVAGNAELNNGQKTGMSVLNNEGGTVQSYLDTDILADTIDNQQGLINAANGVLTISANQDVGATSVDNTNGNLQAASALSLSTEGLNNTLGHIIQRNSSGYLTLQENSQADAVTSFSGQGGVVQAGGDLNIATHSLAGASQVSAGHNLNLVYAGDLQEPVLLQAGADATLKIDGTYKVNVGSGVLAGGASTITAGNVINSGALIAQTGNLTLTSGTDIYNTGLLSAGVGLSLFLPGMLSNVQGAILAQSGSLHISAADGSSSGALLNSSGAIEAEGPAGDMVIQAASITNKMTTPIVIKKDQVLWSHDYTGQEQTTVDIPVPVGLLDAATGLQGTGMLHAYLNYNHKKGSSNSIHVEDYGSSITLTSPAPLMAAGHDMRLTTVDGIINDAGHITAGNDITLSGGSLNNVGYDTEHAFYVTCTSFGGCNWESKSVTPVFNGTNTTARKKKKLAGLETKWKAAPQYREQWGATQNQTAATGSIVAGGNISGIFTGNITNETKKASASAGSFDKFTGPTPQSLSGTAAVAAQGNMSAQQAVQSGPTLASTSTSSQVSAAAQGQNAPVLPSYEGVGPAHITVPAGVAVSPISGGVAVPTTVSVIAALPGGSALFVPNPAPDAHYLIEANPAYANLNAFHGSEYLLDRLGSQPQDYIFLGDSAFDTQSVQQQLVSATGKTFMGASYQTPTQQMQQLLDGAVQEAGTLGLRVGESLTAAQQANLTQSIVWYIPETVAGKTVLAPHLYLASGQATLQDGAVIAGRNVALVGGSLANSGALSAANALTVEATQGDLNNAGGTMTGGSVALSALQGSIVNQDQLSTYLVTGGQAQAVGKVGSITATSGTASLVATRDILFNGGQLSAAKSASLVAGGSALFDAVQQTASQNIVQRHYQHSASQTDHAVAQIDAGENLSVVALGGDLRTEGAQFTAGQNTNLAAQGSLTLGSVTNTQSGYTHSQHHGFLNKTSTTSSFDSSSQQGTTVASAGTLDLSSGKDMAIVGMVAGGKDVTLQAGGNLSEMALKTTASAFYEKKTSGLFFGTSGASQTTGYKKQHDIENRSQTTWTPSSITSAGGNLTLQSKGAVTLDASTVSAAKDLSISGSSVAFKAEQNSVDQSAYHRDKSIGFTARVSPNSVVGQIINTALAATKTSGKGSGALKVMDAMQAGYLAGSAINQARDNAGTLFDTNKADRSSGNLELAGIQAGVGLASNRRSAVQTESSVQGANALAGGTLSVVARGDSPADGHNGGISAVAAQLAGQNIVLAAEKDITLLAGWDKAHNESRMSSNNAFVGAEASIGTTGAGISVTASVDRQTQHVVSSSATAVDTTLTATQGVAITSPEAVRLNGAEVTAPRIDVAAGSLEITSPQNTYEYKS